MNIRKSKVVKNREWSASTQKKLASMLGVSAMISAAALTACDFGSNTTDRNVSGSELSSSSVDLPPESGVVEPPEPTCGELPCDGYERLSSSSEQQNSSSSSEPPLSAGILPPQIDESSSSSYSIDSLEVTSGEIAPPDTLEPESGSPFDQLHDLSSSSTIPEFPPQAGVVEPDFGSSSSSVDVLPSSSSNEVEIDSTLTAGLPVIEESSSSEEEFVTAGLPVIEESSSSAEERYIPAGDPVLPPEPEDMNN
ncbi:hypothetical protein [Fibrobacter sp.]|uniref:hypothetical protein n=1 Tax=Fibrobacter sp. TaxID=35828 RepID=UPI00386B80D1